MEQIKRGRGLPGGIVGSSSACGMEVLVSVSVSVSVGSGRGLRVLDGLLGGLRGGVVTDSASFSVSGGVGNECGLVCFFCLRASFLFNPALRLIASLLMYSVAGIFSGSTTGGSRAVGLATCSRVDAFDI